MVGEPYTYGCQSVGTRRLWPEFDLPYGANHRVTVTNKGLVVGDDISEGYHYISGNVVGNDATGIEVQTRNARIHLDHVYAVRNDVDVVLPDGSNEVRVTDSTIESMIGAPKTINHLGIAAVDGTTPPPEEWDIGDVVEVTSPDGEGVDGLYLKSRDGSWRRIDRAG